MNKKRWGFGILAVVLAGFIAGFIYLLKVNRYQSDGQARLKGLSSAAKVIRDEKGMPYVYAENMSDLMKVQGYVTAQDRLFQMHMVRLFAQGRLTEFVGEQAKDLDIRMRTIGLHRNAIKHAKILSRETRESLQDFADGINQYLDSSRNNLQLEFKLAGTTPESWKIEDSIAIIYYMGWGAAANIRTEMISQMLIEKIGIKRFLEIFPVNTNPDDTTVAINSSQPPLNSLAFSSLEPQEDARLMGFFTDGMSALDIGSNAWVGGSSLSVGGKPIVASDPQLDARLLPGIFYPLGLITPEMRVVGVTVPGIPGIMIGRNQYVANGVTNAYGDAQDLYIETIDPENPDNYLEKGNSIPFQIISETLKIKDKNAPYGFREEAVEIRLTNRGAVISGILKPLETDKVVTMRWGPFETMEPALGLDFLLTSKSVDDVRESLRSATTAHFNVTFADVDGNLGWQTTGRLPIRNVGNGTVPVDANRNPDTWSGWVPYEETPHQYGSDRDWIGNANNNTVKNSYPYYYSSYFSPYYRYQRLIELMGGPGKKSVDDHWNYQRDDLNVLARRITPILVKALALDQETKEMAEILRNWDYHDRLDAIAPAIYQAIYRHLAVLTYEDELGRELAATMLSVWYFWQERLETMIVEGNSSWFDVVSTPDREESLTDLILMAGKKAKKELSDSLGNDVKGWSWGQVHQISNPNPIRRSGFGKEWLGGKSRPMSGSGETLYRALYDFNNPDEIMYSAAIRMVADLGDNDKVAAVMHGGVTGRTFHPHFKDQLEAYHDGSKLYWWFSDKKIQEHKQSELALVP
jgi:penicillin amidase